LYRNRYLLSSALWCNQPDVIVQRGYGADEQGEVPISGKELACFSHRLLAAVGAIRLKLHLVRTWRCTVRTSQFAQLRRAIAILGVFGLLLVAVPSVSANVRLKEGAVPFYARLERGGIYHTDDWAGIVFYRPPMCIPEDFNLLDFFDIPRVFDCNPPTTDGFAIWEHGPGIDAAPLLVELHGLGAVPVWFVRWPALQAAIADDTLTIGELVSLQPLVGSATAYQETLRPTGEVKASTFELNARGWLVGGRSFQFEATAIEAAPHNSGFVHTRIVFR
jgi:hypothetical protein